MPTPERPLILISNDDGIHSPGLRALVEAVRGLGEILVVAPKEQQSSVGRGFLGGSGEVEEEDLGFTDPHIRAYSIEGSPALAARHGALLLASRKPDLCLSGINYGENMGAGITISGTIGATIEAATFGIPGIAVSFEVEEQYHHSHEASVDFSVAAVFAHRFASRVLTYELPPDVDILKVDVPQTATSTTPWRVTRVSRRPYYQSVIGYGADGRKEFAGYHRQIDVETLEPDSDIYALVVDRVVSVAPVAIHMRANVDRQLLERLLSNEDKSQETE